MTRYTAQAQSNKTPAKRVTKRATKTSRREFVASQLYCLQKHLIAHNDRDLYEKVKEIYFENGGVSKYTTKLLRQLVGKYHWDKVEALRCRATVCDDLETTLRRLPRPRISPALNMDVTEIIFSFLDDASICTAMSVNKSFCNILAPHRQNVCASKFRSLDSFQRWNFQGMVFLSARHCSVVNDAFLKFLSENPSRYRNIANVDLYGCKNLTLPGVVDFVYTMGSRLEGFSLRHFDEKKITDTQHMRCLEILLTSHTPCLQSLSLELNRAWAKEFRLCRMNGHPSLRTLSLTLDYRIILPSNLPQLENLQLKIVDDYVRAYWTMLQRNSYPRLKRLEVAVCSYAVGHLELELDLLIATIKTNFPALEYLAIQREEHKYPMNDSYDRKRFLIPEGIRSARYRSPKVEAAELQRLTVFAKARKIRIKCL